MAKTVSNRLSGQQGSSGVEGTIRRWWVGYLPILLVLLPLAGITHSAAPEATVTWHEVGEGVWDLLGLSRDRKTAYLMHNRLGAIQGNKETRVAYRLLAVDLTTLKLTTVVPTKVIERDRYLILVVNRQHFFVGRVIHFLSPDKTKVAITDDPYCEVCYEDPKEKIFLLDLKTLSEKLINAQNTVRGYRRQALYAKAGPDADRPPTWASPRGWLSNHEILYISERTGDGESLWLIDIRNKSERLLLKEAALEKKWGYPVTLWHIRVIDKRRLLLSGGYNADEIPQDNVTDLRGNILRTFPRVDSEHLSPDRTKIISMEMYTKKGQRLLLPPTVQNLNTGRNIPLPPSIQSLGNHGAYYWRAEGDAFASLLYPTDDLSQALLAVVDLDEARNAATLKTIPTDLSKGLFTGPYENQVAFISWLDQAHLLVTTVKARPYIEERLPEPVTWIITLR